MPKCPLNGGKRVREPSWQSREGVVVLRISWSQKESMRENGRERRGLSRDGGTKGRGNREGCNQIRQSSSAYTLTLDTLWVWKGLSLGCNRAGKGGEGLWGIVLGA